MPSRLSTNEKMTDSVKKYKEFLSAIYEKTLKPAGFRKYGGNFRRITRSAIFTTGKLVSFRGEAKDGSVIFTVLLGKKSSFNDEPDASFNTCDCTLAERTYLSELSEGQNVCRRWTVDGNTDINALTDGISGLIKTYAFPWFRFDETTG